MPTRRARSEAKIPSGSSRFLDLEEVAAPWIDAGELFRCQHLVLGEVNLAAALGRRIDEAIDRLTTRDLVVRLRMEFKVEAVAVFGEREQAVVRAVGAQNGRDRRTGRRPADVQQFDDGVAGDGSWKRELDGVPARAADKVGRRYGETGFETEPEKELGVRRTARPRRPVAQGVVEPVEEAHQGALDEEHERQDRAERLVEREAEPSMPVESLVARVEDFAPSDSLSPLSIHFAA